MIVLVFNFFMLLKSIFLFVVAISDLVTHVEAIFHLIC